jgi:RNA polymerase sigma-70 factor (ECF subfamily)
MKGRMIGDDPDKRPHPDRPRDSGFDDVPASGGLADNGASHATTSARPSADSDAAAQARAQTDPFSRALRRVALHRDEAAFAELFQYFAPRIRAWLIKTGCASAQADEVMQDAMTLVWRKARLYDPARAGAATWIFTIVRNRHIDLIRKQRRPEPEDLPWAATESPDPEATVAVSQDSIALRAAIARLPQRQRDVIARAYFADLSHSEIAEVMNLPLGTIKSRIRLGLERLRHELSARQ